MMPEPPPLTLDLDPATLREPLRLFLAQLLTDLYALYRLRASLEDHVWRI